MLTYPALWPKEMPMAITTKLTMRGPRTREFFLWPTAPTVNNSRAVPTTWQGDSQKEQHLRGEITRRETEKHSQSQQVECVQQGLVVSLVVVVVVVVVVVGVVVVDYDLPGQWLHPGLRCHYLEPSRRHQQSDCWRWRCSSHLQQSEGRRPYITWMAKYSSFYIPKDGWEGER